MKKILLLLTVLVFSIRMQAQQIPMFSEMYFMRMLYNPALTGYNGSSNLYGFYRNQWVNLPGHPVTTGALGDISLWKDRSAVGFDVFSDKTDIIHRIHADLYYAQKVRIAKDHIISLGVTLGVAQTYIDFGNAVINDPNDPHLLLTGKSGLAFNMNIGLAYQWKKLTVGFSVPQVLNTYSPINTQTNYATYGMQRHYIGNVSYEISIAGEKYNIEPMVQVKKGTAQPVQIDASVMANYKRMIFLGVGYSLDYGVAVMGAVRIGHVVTLGYAYDVPVMTHLTYGQTKGTHEIIVGINFDKWLKKGNKDKKNEFAKKSDVDSIVAKMQKQIDSIQQATDSLQQTTDSLKQASASLQKSNTDLQKTNDALQTQQQEQQELMRDMKLHLDSFENVDQQYKKNIAKNPAKNFPSNVGKETTAQKGDVFRLSNVGFEHNSSYLTSVSYAELDKVVDFLKLNPTMKVRINGHTDNQASEGYNQWLSDRRAKRVYDYLLEHGAPADRMSYFGFGKRTPIADNSTDEGRAKNRRVEIEVLKK